MAWWRRSPAPDPSSLPDGPLADFLATTPPDRHTPVGDLRLLAVDVETTGLDPRRDHILSVGFVPIEDQEIVLSGARHFVVRAAADVGDSATIHGLTDDVVAGGVPLGEALDAVLHALTGRVLLGHHVGIERGFLKAAVGMIAPAAARAFNPTAVCTMQLERVLIAPGLHQEPPIGALRLWRARERYGLHESPAHDALVDAIGCAELYLAQTAELLSRKAAELRHLP